MRLPVCIIKKSKKKQTFLSLPIIGNCLVLFVLLAFAENVSGQKVAILPVSENQQTLTIIKHFEKTLSSKFNILDTSLVQTAVEGAKPENLFNLSQDEAKNLGNAIGCDFFIIFKSETITRSSSAQSLYYESYVVLYVVSSKTGKLIFWSLKKSEDLAEKTAEQNLDTGIKILVSEIITYILAISKQQKNTIDYSGFKRLPEENSEDFKSFRSPLPYKRLKPIYPDLAALYLVEATIDVEVFLNEKGEVVNLEIVRWGGFGLEESVSEVIRRMQWQPALKDGKALPIRVLLRYNFKKLKNSEKN